jgi:diguanylate cyclase (GGDEF)-like protein
MLSARLTLKAYVTAVIVAGLVALVVALKDATWYDMVPHSALGWLLVVFLVVGELLPVRVPVGDEAQEVSTSTAFGFALVLVAKLPMVALVHAISTTIVDFIARRPWWKVAFNVAQIEVALVATSMLLHGGGISSLRYDSVTVGRLFTIVACGLVFFLINNSLVCGAIAIAENKPLLRVMRTDVAFQLKTGGVLLSLAPLLVGVSRVSVLLVPLFAPVVIAVYHSMRVSVEKERQALHDALTGLPNRTLFMDRVRSSIEVDNNAVAVMLIDLDYFKDVNDTLGHHVGDVLLQGIAVRLQDAVGEDALVARLGGDEFAVLLEHVDRSQVRELATQVLSRLSEPFRLDDVSFHIEASIGAAIAPADANDCRQLIQKADVAMYTAKEARSGFEFYDLERDQYSPKRLALLSQLRSAIDENQLVLHYQPKAENATNRVFGVEALVRWEHPEHGLVMPDEFIPLAEPTGMITRLTMHVLESALRQWQEWNRLGLDLTIAVNISVRSLYEPHFPDAVYELLQRFGMPADRLDLELTESAVMADPQRALTALNRLDAMGVRLTLDDFGTGYSSLAHLKRLPVSHIKIDKSFVLNMAWDEEDVAIVCSTVNLARTLGLTVTAEGVESEVVQHQLRDLQCDFFQGYYLSRPVATPQLLAWLLLLGPDRVPVVRDEDIAAPATAAAEAEVVTLPPSAIRPALAS